MRGRWELSAEKLCSHRTNTWRAGWVGVMDSGNFDTPDVLKQLKAVSFHDSVIPAIGAS
jgi:hypothetical protein